jgi:hypothetical protein
MSLLLDGSTKPLDGNSNVTVGTESVFHALAVFIRRCLLPRAGPNETYGSQKGEARFNRHLTDA